MFAFDSSENNPTAPEPRASKTLVLIIPRGDAVCKTHFEFARVLK